MNANAFSILIQNLFIQSPVIVVCFVACVVTFLNWQESPKASVFALLGFGLSLAVCLVAPAVTVAMQGLMRSGGQFSSEKFAATRYIFVAVSIFWALLRAASYGLLLAAVYTDRSARQTAQSSAPPTPPALPR